MFLHNSQRFYRRLQITPIAFAVALGSGCESHPWRDHYREVTQSDSGGTRRAVRSYAYVLTRATQKEVDVEAMRRLADFDLPARSVVRARPDSGWRPKRHFGPFSAGSDFEQVRIGLNPSQPTG